MSELNEDLLNDDNEDFADIGEAEEDALLQDDDDGDVLDIAPEDDLGESTDLEKTMDDSKHRQGKFTVERHSESGSTAGQFVRTAGASGFSNKVTLAEAKRYNRQNNRGRGRGVRFQQGRRIDNQFRQPITGKTVHINPRFRGVVPVNNNARLVWDHQQRPQPQPQQSSCNVWVGQGPPMNMQQPPPLVQQQYHQVPQYPMQMQPPPIQNMGPPPMHMQYYNQVPQQEYLSPPPLNVMQSTMNGPPPYGHGNFNHPQNLVMNYPPPLIQQPPPTTGPNFQYNAQFTRGMVPQQPQFDSNDNFVHNNGNNGHNFQQNSQELFSSKRKSPFQENKRKLPVRDRLGLPKKLQVQVNNFVKSEERPSVVREVTVTNVTTVQISQEEDKETKDLRLKIEEQKRKREQLLKWKELRRLEKLKEAESQSIKTVINQNQVKTVMAPRYQSQNRAQNQRFAVSSRAPVLQPMKRVEEHHLLLASGKADEPTMNEREMSSFLSNRKVLVKDEALLQTRKVVIKNIATSTGDKKIIQICKSIGEVQKLHRDKNERQATITFKSVASAHAFFKKYQRHMLDLSMIEVVLAPETEEPQQYHEEDQ